MGFGDTESLERCPGSRKWIKNESRVDGREDIEGTERTFFDKSELPLGSFALLIEF